MIEKCLKSVLTLLLIFAPLLATAATLTNTDIDRFIEAVPVTAPVLGAMKTRLQADEALRKRMALAQMNGRLHRELLKLTADWPEQAQLAERANKQSFDSLSAWALVADRIAAVMASAQWVVAAASMPIPNSDRATLAADTNLFAYLQDDTNDTPQRDKYRRQLKEMCERMCVDTNDLSIVSKRYDDIRAALAAQ